MVSTRSVLFRSFDAVSTFAYGGVFAIEGGVLLHPSVHLGILPDLAAPQRALGVCMLASAVPTVFAALAAWTHFDDGPRFATFTTIAAALLLIEELQVTAHVGRFRSAASLIPNRIGRIDEALQHR